MKKFLILISSIVMIFVMASISFANEDALLSAPNPMASTNQITVQLDGEYIDFIDASGDVVNPQIINGRTMVPFRKIFNSLGVTDENIEWIKETRTVIASKDELTIELQIDNAIAKKTISGETTSILLDAAPVIVNGRTLVPARFIAESMGKKVGWDDIYRTVIIIDEEKLNNDLESSISKYIEVVKLQTTPLNTFDTTVDLNMDINYTEKGNKANNTNLDVTGKIDMIKSSDAIYMNFEIDFTGKGSMYDAIKEINLTSVEISIIVSGNKLYMKSALLGEEYEDKWAAIESDSVSEMFAILETSYANPGNAKFLVLDENNLNVNSYATLKLTSEMFKAMLKDENVKISGTSTKKYEVDLDLFDLINFMNGYGAEMEVDYINEVEMKVTGTVKDGVATSSKVEMDLEIVEDTEKIVIELDAVGKINSYNKTYKIDIPSEKEIISE